MTEKDLEIQGLRRELQEIVENARLCRYCAYCNADCSPYDNSCTPKWRGLKHES